jgi:hypothetical protein
VNSKELYKKLKGIGATKISDRTLRDWAAKGLITAPKEVSGKKPGRRFDWPEESYREAAAVWSIRHLYPHLKALKTDNETLVKVRQEARNIYGSFDTFAWLFSCFFFALERSKSGKFEYVGRELNQLVVLWIVAMEKAQRKKKLQEPANITFRWLVQPPFDAFEERGKKDILFSQKVELNSVTTYVCYPERRLDPDNAVKPGVVIAATVTETGSLNVRNFDYSPP